MKTLKIILVIACLATSGCATMSIDKPVGKIEIKENIIKFYATQPIDMKYKDAEFSSKKESMIKDVMKIMAIKEINK